MGNPFAEMPGLPVADVLIESALNRANKVLVPQRRDALFYSKEINLARINRSAFYVKRHFERIDAWWRRVAPLGEFYSDLLEIMVGRDRFVGCIMRVRGAAGIIELLRARYIKKVKLSKDAKQPGRYWREFFGRLSSVIRRNRRCISLLNEARAKLRGLPSIDENRPVIVVAGPPNVGKSSLVAKVSTKKPEVAAYPFTTKNISLGHIVLGDRVAQIMDTPGLLDRPVEKRNSIELQAITALSRVATHVIFMFDPSESCGYPFRYQLSVYLSIFRLISSKPMFIVLNKMDLLNYVLPKRIEVMLINEGISRWIPISTRTGYGVKELMNVLSASL